MISKDVQIGNEVMIPHLDLVNLYGCSYWRRFQNRYVR